MQGDQTRSVAGQPPAHQRQARRRQRDPQAGNVRATLYDIDLRDIPLGFDMPALSDSAQGWCGSDKRTGVLRRPEGCTIEALVVNPHACCKSDENVQAVQQLPWWPRAEQMRSLVAAGTLTLGHWAAQTNTQKLKMDKLYTVLYQQQNAAVSQGTLKTQKSPQEELEAKTQDFYVREKLASYFRDVANQSAAEERERALALAAELAALQISPAQQAAPSAVPAVTTQTRQLPPLDPYGQECRPQLSNDVGQALYDSVYKATWGALRFKADGVHEKTSKEEDVDVVLPIVPCGMLPDTLVMDASSVAAARRKSTAPDVLTLYSPLGWPAMWVLATLPKRAPLPDEVERRVTAASVAQQLALESDDNKNTLFVRGEVQRVWRRIEHTRDKAQHLRRGSATTQGTATAAAAAPAQAQGGQGNDAAAAPAQAQTSENEEQVASTAISPAQAQGERHSDPADADAHDEQHDDATSTHGQTQMHRDDCNDEAEEHVSAQDGQQSNAAEAPAQALAQGEQHSNVAQLQAAQGSAVPSQSSTSSNTDATSNKDAFVIIRGTPGIGKSMAVGGYVLYKLLHEEGERALPYVLFEVDELSFVFDKRNKTVACYERASFSALSFVRAVDCQCARIFDCSKTCAFTRGDTKKGAKLNIVITSPNAKNIEDIRNNKVDNGLLRYANVHAWSLREMLLVGRYLDIGEATVKARVTTVGPLPRFVYTYDKEKFDERVRDIDWALRTNDVKGIDIPLCSFEVDSIHDKDNPTNKVFDLRRAADDPDDTTTQDNTKTAAAASKEEEPTFSFYNIPLSIYAYKQFLEAMLEKQGNNELYFGGLLCNCIDHPKVFEHAVIQLFATQAMWAYITGADNKGVRRCMYMSQGRKGKAGNEPDTPLRRGTLRAWLAGIKDHNVACFDDGATITFDTRDVMRVFKPNESNFPLVDAFVLLYYAQRVHYIGIQVTIKDTHKPTADNVRSFYNRHPLITFALEEEQQNWTVSLTCVTPPTLKINPHINSPALKDISVDELDENVLGNVNGTRSMLYVRKHDSKDMSYQPVQKETNVKKDILANWEKYAQYCCKVRTSYVHPTAKFTTQEAYAETAMGKKIHGSNCCMQ